MTRTILLLATLCWISNAQFTQEETVIQLPPTQNLTVSFFPEDTLTNGEEGQETCPTSSPSALKFSTGSVPAAGIVGHSVCYNIHELFAMNNTLNSSGLYNYTGDARGYSPLPRVSYTLSPAENWSPEANYSRIRYKQVNATEGEGGEGEDAAFMFQTYPGLNCRQEGPPGANMSEEILPWIRWGCQSSGEGDCYTIPYRIKSFRILDASRNHEEGKCVVAAVYGAGNRVGVFGKWAVWGVGVGVLVAMVM